MINTWKISCQGFFFESAAFRQAGDKGALFFSGFFNQKFSATNRTFPLDAACPR